MHNYGIYMPYKDITPDQADQLHLWPRSEDLLPTPHDPRKRLFNRKVLLQWKKG